jgi:hypothetical protein
VKKDFKVASLFSETERTRITPLRRGERLYDFYNSSGCAGYDAFRSTLDNWLSEMGDADRSSLVSSMQRGGDQAFRAGLCELMVHALLRRLGNTVLVHPTLTNRSTQPDFAITNAGGERSAYVEVTTINLAAQRESQANRENPIYNAIDGIALPEGCILDYELIEAGLQSPSLTPLVASIEQWTRDNVVAARAQYISRRFSAGDWTIELGLIAEDATWQASRAIGAASLGGGIICPHRDIRKALQGKARKYGALHLPYLIVVADGKDQLSGPERIQKAITEAVFGDEIIQSNGGRIRQTYAANGFWRGSNGPQNQNVSGLLLLPDTGLWHLRNERRQPLLASNPWASHDLPADLLRLSHLACVDDRWTFVQGEPLADILGLLSPWPPEEAS